MIYPLPAVLVSCGATPDEYNLLTVAWTGTVCTNPPICYISVRPERHSYDLSLIHISGREGFSRNCRLSDRIFR